MHVLTDRGYVVLSALVPSGAVCTLHPPLHGHLIVCTLHQPLLSHLGMKWLQSSPHVVLTPKVAAHFAQIREESRAVSLLTPSLLLSWSRSSLLQSSSVCELAIPLGHSLHLAVKAALATAWPLPPLHPPPHRPAAPPLCEQ